MKTWRSIVSLLLILVFALELLPLSSFAEESNDLTATEAVETAQPVEQSASDAVSTDEPYVVSEVEELREEAVKHFRMSDGSFLAVQYVTPVHYKDENDQWQEIDNTLIEKNGKLVTKYGNVEKTFSQTLSDGKLFDVKVGDYSLGMSLMSPGGKTGDVVMAAEDSEQADLPTTAQDAEQTGEVTEEHAGEQSAESAEASDVSQDSKASKKTADSADNEATESIEAEEKVTPAPAEPSAAPTPSEESVMRVVAAPSIKAAVESKAPMRVSASERLTAEKLAARELSTAEVFYANALQSVDLNYQSTTNSVKESIIIKAPQTSYVYTFLLTLKGVTPELQDDGAIVCANKDGNPVFVIPAPYLIDLAGEVSLDAKYDLEKKSNGWVLTVTANEEWLNDPERQFPVTLDPTTYVQVDGLLGNIYATYVCSGAPNATHVEPTLLPVGYDETGPGQLQSFMAFEPFQINFSQLQVVNAKLYLSQSSYVSTNQSVGYITAHQVTTSPGNASLSSWINAMTWNNKPSFSSDIIDYAKVTSGTTELALDVTRAVQSWYEDNPNTKAIALSMYYPRTSGREVSYLIGHYTSNVPAMTIQYKNDVGIEEFYSYQSFDVGNAGTAYISDHSGELTVVTPLASFASKCNPFSLNLVYNSHYDPITVNDYPLEHFGTKLGSGMTLNYIQTAKIYGNSIKYIDGDGTIHFFSKRSSSDPIYYDEDGLGLKITVIDQWHFVMTNDDGAEWTFMNGILALCKDSNGNQYEIHYIRGNGELDNWHPYGQNDILDKVVQKNANGSTITVATFEHDSNGFLTSITDFAGRKTTLSYSPGFNDTKLVGISRDGIQRVSFTYYGEESKITDCVSGCGLAFVRNGKKLTSFHYFGSGTGNNRETTSISYGKGHTTYTTNGISTTYLFDLTGRTVNAYTEQNGVVIGAENAVFADAVGSNSNNNHMLQTARIGVAANSWMRNGNFENNTSFPWSFTGVDATNTNIVVNGDCPRTGKFALKGWLRNGASGTTTATRQTYTLTNGRKYAASVYVNTENITAFGSGGCVKLEVLNSGNVLLGSDSIKLKSSNVGDGWARLVVCFTGNGAAAKIRISAINAQGIFYADDVQVEPSILPDGEAAPSNVNLIDNGNLQYYGGGWTVSGMHFCTNVGRGVTGSGAYSIQADGDPASAEKAYQTVPINLASSETYVLSGWAKANSLYTGETAITAGQTDPTTDQSKRFGLCAELKYSDEEIEYHYVPFNADIVDWQYVSLAIVPKRENQVVSSITVSCVYNFNARTAYFDDLSLVREAAQTMKYDSEGNLISVMSTGNKKEENAFSNGKLIQTVKDGSGSLSFSYSNPNNSHQITQISDGVVKENFIYDTSGNITQEDYSSIQGGAPIRKTYSYSNDGNRLESETTFGIYDYLDCPNSVLTTYSYSNNYNKMLAAPSMVCQSQTTITNSYDQDYDKVIQRTESDAGTLSYVYNNNGYLDTLTRTNYTGGDSQSYSNAYNSFGDRTATYVGNILLANFSFDAETGNLNETAFGNGDVVEFRYDSLNRLTGQTTYSAGTERNVSYVYSGNGDLYLCSDSTGEQTRYFHDSLGRLVELRKTGFNKDFQASYQYDDYGRLKKQQFEISGLFGDSEEFIYRNVSDSSGAAGSVAQINMASGDTVVNSYDALYRLNTRKIGSAIQESFDYKLSYDNSSTPVISLKTNMVDAKAIRDLNAGNAALYRWSYVYDRNGNIVKETNEVSNQVITYSYDRQNQLTGVVTPSTSYVYSYDQAGNIQTARIGNTTHTYTYENAQWKDLLTAYDGHAISYDTIGNPLSYYNGENYTFSWVGGRQLSTANHNNYTTTFSYDADGYRSRKTFSTGGHIDYYWANGVLLGEVRYTVFNIATNYIRYHYDENGSPVGFTNNGTDFYYAKNLQGDVVAIYKKVNNNGSVTTSCVARYDYDPWGKCTVKTASGQVDILLTSVGHINPFRFKGYYYDTETGFYYLQSRYYDPVIGRFINADTFADNGQGFIGSNMFAYCNNNPVNNSDPTGQFSLFGKGILKRFTQWIKKTFSFSIRIRKAVENLINIPPFRFARGSSYVKMLSQLGDKKAPFTFSLIQFETTSFHESFGGFKTTQYNIGVEALHRGKNGGFSYQIATDGFQLTIANRNNTAVSFVNTTRNFGLIICQGVDWDNQTIETYNSYTIDPIQLALEVILVEALPVAPFSKVASMG